jgi:methyl-accepting chemotaxis protein
MVFFSALSIRYKVLSIVAVAIIGFVVYFSVNFQVASSNAHHLEQLRGSIFPSLERSEKNLVRLKEVVALLDAAVATEEEDNVEEAEQTIQLMQVAFSEIAKLSPSVAEASNELKQSLNEYFSVASTLTLGMLNGDIRAAQISVKVQAMQVKYKTFNEALIKLRDERYRAFTETIESADEAASFGLTMGMLIGAVLILVLAITGYVVASGIVANVSGVSGNLREIASGEGDLTRRLEARSQDEVGSLVGYFNTFIDKLQGIIRELMANTGMVNTAAEELASIAQKSRESMEQQRIDTDQVATASTQMAATVVEVAQHASLAAEAANSANTAAHNGNNVVDETIAIINRLAEDVSQGASAVSQLREDSQKVGSVLDVIRGIAEQTNLLALNAAIEAARAGEQGRGFAVVADEVRTLASRTQESTQEIQTMIEHLQASAGNASEVMQRGILTSDAGVAKAADAGEALNSITQAVDVIRDMNTQIASAAEEQSAVAAEMDKNITNISRASEENTDNSNQLASAGASLSQLATRMQSLVGQFKV